MLAGATAQAAPDLARARAQLAVERLRVDGRKLMLHWPEHRSSPRMIRNLRLRVEGRDNAERARRFLEQIPELVGGAASQLQPLDVRGTRDVAVHRFRQVYRGVEVEGAGVNVVFDRAGLIRALHANAEPVDLDSVAPTLTPRQAAAVAEKAALGRHTRRPSVEPPRLLILSGATPRLAFRILLRGDPTFRIHYVDARDGRYLGSRRGMIVDASTRRGSLEVRR